MFSVRCNERSTHSPRDFELWDHPSGKHGAIHVGIPQHGQFSKQFQWLLSRGMIRSRAGTTQAANLRLRFLWSERHADWGCPHCFQKPQVPCLRLGRCVIGFSSSSAHLSRASEPFLSTHFLYRACSSGRSISRKASLMMKTERASPWVCPCSSTMTSNSLRNWRVGYSRLVNLCLKAQYFPSTQGNRCQSVPSGSPLSAVRILSTANMHMGGKRRHTQGLSDRPGTELPMHQE